uniref:Protein kinase domain-containing protein n=1 Tax=Strongyloides papillosus TaxID=174720 RepID=A0A0N5BLN4_STREA
MKKKAVRGFGVIFKNILNDQFVATKAEILKNRISISEKNCLSSISNSGIDSLPFNLDIIEDENLSLRFLALSLYHKNLCEYTHEKKNKCLTIHELTIVNISVLRTLNYLNTFQYIYNDIKETNLMLRHEYFSSSIIVLEDLKSTTIFSRTSSNPENVDITPCFVGLWIHKNILYTYTNDLVS